MRRPFVLLSLLAAAVAGPSSPAAEAYPLCVVSHVQVNLVVDNWTTPPCLDYPYGMQCEWNRVWKPDTFDVYLAYCYPNLTTAPSAVHVAATSVHSTPRS